MKINACCELSLRVFLIKKLQENELQKPKTLKKMTFIISVKPKSIKKTKRKKLRKNIKNISPWLLALCSENWGSGKKNGFLIKKTCNWWHTGRPKLNSKLLTRIIREHPKKYETGLTSFRHRQSFVCKQDASKWAKMAQSALKWP